MPVTLLNICFLFSVWYQSTNYAFLPFSMCELCLHPFLRPNKHNIMAAPNLLQINGWLVMLKISRLEVSYDLRFISLLKVAEK